MQITTTAAGREGVSGTNKSNIVHFLNTYKLGHLSRKARFPITNLIWLPFFKIAAILNIEIP